MISNKNIRRQRDELNDVEADEDEDGADEVGLQHLVALLTVPLLRGVPYFLARSAAITSRSGKNYGTPYMSRYITSNKRWERLLPWRRH